MQRFLCIFLNLKRCNTSMTLQESKAQWTSLHTRWISTDKIASELERQLMTALRLCVESKAEPPSHDLIEALSKARREATACRTEVDSFVVRLFGDV